MTTILPAQYWPHKQILMPFQIIGEVCLRVIANVCLINNRMKKLQRIRKCWIPGKRVQS